ncbi:GGDEF domain-containing protein [Lederbergia sp. NSJ-179]|uniref:diguanylate cyclase domain-containing protein n=1 Tax=Lederbergia sp. NSJ-179 TaxID=2931402 RepID=UPI001FCFB5CD|nr:diguanylate cyclase [Lederbergia sp. NSJ-179]MCJ7840168.1 GGDEF domain-containing protein [Lederbergia sp. NSJ-179]
MDLNQMDPDNSLNKSVKPDSFIGLHSYDDFLKLVDRKGKALRLSEKVYLIYVQLDQFTQIQDILGSQYAELVLKTMRQRLQKVIKRLGFASYNGGGFFCLCLLDKLLEKNIHKVMEEITRTLVSPIYIQDQKVYSTYSYGISCYPEHGEKAKDCMQKAKIALNREKNKIIRD